jgi:hypothetical protein
VKEIKIHNFHPPIFDWNPEVFRIAKQSTGLSIPSEFTGHQRRLAGYPKDIHIGFQPISNNLNKPSVYWR